MRRTVKIYSGFIQENAHNRPLGGGDGVMGVAKHQSSAGSGALGATPHQSFATPTDPVTPDPNRTNCGPVVSRNPKRAKLGNKEEKRYIR